MSLGYMGRLLAGVFLALSLGSLSAGLAGCQSTFSPRLDVVERQVEIDYERFLGQHDMVWDRIPDSWPVAPFSGNGHIGFLFHQQDSDAPNSISIRIGRHDYYDQREPYNDEEMLWIYRSRLPLGHFKLTSQGGIVDVELRLSLWNAELIGTITTEEGKYSVRGLTHATNDVIYFETEASEGESVEITWHPEAPIPPVRAKFDEGHGPRAPNWDRMREAPLPMPPDTLLTTSGDRNFSQQILYNHRGEVTVGWQIKGAVDATQSLLASIHYSFPEKDSMETVRENLAAAEQMISGETFLDAHRDWWHHYYPLSFLSLSDPEVEAFYWIQMYKFASASRQDSEILDLMGPWYNYTFWPMVWADLNVQLIYWTHLTSNRLDVGSSLVNSIDRHADNLILNVPEHWHDSAAIGALFPHDMVSDNHSKVPDMLAWLLHNYWLHTTYAGDGQRMRDNLFPILRQVGNSYLNYLKDNPVPSTDGTIHIKNSWSPEYKPGHGQDINFTIALMRWTFKTLLDLSQTHGFDDPKAGEWQNILENLVDFQVDDNGLRIGRDIPFDLPHRHYSHLLALYPLVVISPEDRANKAMLRTSVDHWLDVSINSGIEIDAMPVTGYTATGAASLYATLGEADKAYEYIRHFLKHEGVSPTTMYAEVRDQPVIESPLSFATSIHDMLLQSWGGTIRVFPSAPRQWADISFHKFRTQGAFLVTAKRKANRTIFVEIESLAGSPLRVSTDIEDPVIFINGEIAADGSVSKGVVGGYVIKADQGDRVLMKSRAAATEDMEIVMTQVPHQNLNLFGLNQKTERMPGHSFYYGLDPENQQELNEVAP